MNKCYNGAAYSSYITDKAAKDCSFFDTHGLFVKDGEMYELHEAGIAKAYKSIGLYSTTIEWKKGQRFE